MRMKRIAELIMMAAARPKPVGQVEWTTPGTYYWPVPDNVYSISAAAVGSGNAGGVGGRAGSGPGLRYLITAPVTPGETLTIIVGAPGAAIPVGGSSNANTGGDVRIQRNGVDLLWAQGGQPNAGGGGSPLGGNIGGGNGGTGAIASSTNNAGAGGAGGYAGNGADGTVGTTGLSGNGGAGGGGTANSSLTRGGRGGGVGLRGQGADGIGGTGPTSPSGGDGSVTAGPVVGSSSGSGNNIAGGLGSAAGICGGARIIFGDGRFYPSTRTADE